MSLGAAARHCVGRVLEQWELGAGAFFLTCLVSSAKMTASARLGYEMMRCCGGCDTNTNNPRTRCRFEARFFLQSQPVSLQNETRATQRTRTVGMCGQRVGCEELVNLTRLAAARHIEFKGHCYGVRLLSDGNVAKDFLAFDMAISDRETLICNCIVLKGTATLGSSVI